MTRRQILITKTIWRGPRGIVRGVRMSSRRDQNHLAELDRELDRAEVVSPNDGRLTS